MKFDAKQRREEKKKRRHIRVRYRESEQVATGWLMMKHSKLKQVPRSCIQPYRMIYHIIVLSTTTESRYSIGEHV